jgi:hypothetical protein
MLLEDVLVRGSAVGHLRVMVPAQDVRRSVQLMMTDPPATLGMAIHFSDSGVHAHPNGTDERCLSEVGAKTGPEIVELVGPAVDDPGVKCHPVSESSKERNQKCDRDDDEDEGQHQEEAVATAARRDLGRCRVRRTRSWCSGG